MVIKNILKYYLTACVAAASITLGPEIVQVIRFGASKLMEFVS